MTTFEKRGSLHRAIGFLLLVTLPFLATGLYACWRASGLWAEYTRTKSWVEVPAIIKTTELEDHSTHKSKRFEVFATYDYEFNKQPHSGNRVTLITGLMINFGYFNRNAYNELKLHRVERTPFRCYVNPDAPQESILFRNLPGDALVNLTVLATIPGTIGVGLLTAVLVIVVFGRSDAARLAAASELNKTPSTADEMESNPGNMRMAVFPAVMGIYWTVACLPLDRKIVESITQGGSAMAWVAILFPLVGLMIFYVAVRQIVRVASYGAFYSRTASTLSVARPSMT